MFPFVNFVTKSLLICIHFGTQPKMLRVADFHINYNLTSEKIIAVATNNALLSMRYKFLVTQGFVMFKANKINLCNYFPKPLIK